MKDYWRTGWLTLKSLRIAPSLKSLGNHAHLSCFLNQAVPSQLYSRLLLEGGNCYYN